MKILHVTDNFEIIKGGVPSAVSQLSDNLIKKNHDVLILHTSILNYESNLFNKIKFFFIEPNLDSILL